MGTYWKYVTGCLVNHLGILIDWNCLEWSSIWPKWNFERDANVKNIHVYIKVLL